MLNGFLNTQEYVIRVSLVEQVNPFSVLHKGCIQCLVLLNLICTVKEPKFALYETVSTTLDVKLHCSYTGFINNLKFFLNVASNIPSQDLVNCKKGSLVHGLYFLLSFSVMKSIRFDSYLIAFQISVCIKDFGAKLI